MTRWIDVGKTEECVAVYAGWHRVDRHTVGGIDKFSVVVILECLRCTGGCLSVGYCLEIAVKSAFCAYNRARSECRNDIREIKFYQKFGYEV